MQIEKLQEGLKLTVENGALLWKRAIRIFTTPIIEGILNARFHV